MDKTYRQETITLIGPGGVGKSLIAKTLSEKTGLPIISTDKIFHYVCKDMLYNFYGSNHKKAANKIKKSYLANLPKEKDPKIREHQLKLIDEAAEDYLRYAKMFAGFSQFYNITNWREEVFGHLVEPTTAEVVAINQSYVLQMLEIIFDKIDSPVIFDMGATFGWQFPNNYNLSFDGFSINTFNLNKQISDTLSTMGTVVLIEPGEDYKIRRPEKANYYNSHLIENFDNYYDNADILISSNGFFNNPENNAFEKRLMFDAKSKQTRERLKNHSNINSLCEQILESKEDLKSLQP